EIGGTYGKVLRESEYAYLKAALSVNVLLGFNGSYMKVNTFDYTVLDTSLMVVHNMDATINYSANPTAQNVGADFVLRGAGLGTNIGATYIRKRQRSGFECRKSSDKIKKYNYRIGVSLMDFGLIRFFKDENKIVVNSNSDSFWTGADSTDFNGINSIDTILSSNINGTVSESSKSFSMITPTAISIQFDYSITPQVFANASWVNRVHFAPNQIARGNQINLSMRYEVRRWEVNGNLSLFEYKKPSMGIAFRYAFFIIGTDRLLEWTGLTDVYGFDFFFGLKFNLCKLSLKNDDPECPAFGSLY
ncbi:MAG: hypothetical protein KA444_10660, partial [Bacteroidia bacterium]|nr:hypothetical protein [Bacteroidia bacterium]